MGALKLDLCRVHFPCVQRSDVGRVSWLFSLPPLVGGRRTLTFHATTDDRRASVCVHKCMQTRALSVNRTVPDLGIILEMIE